MFEAGVMRLREQKGDADIAQRLLGPLTGMG